MPIPSHHRSFCGSSNQSSHDDFVRQMANNPGRNSSNIIRQDLSKVFLHCLFQATSSQQSDSTTASSGSSLTAVIYPSAHHAVCASQYALLRSRTCSNGTKKSRTTIARATLLTSVHRQYFRQSINSPACKQPIRLSVSRTRKLYCPATSQ